MLPELDIPDPVGRPTAEAPHNKFSVHLPFILAFDSDISRSAVHTH